MHIRTVRLLWLMGLLALLSSACAPIVGVIPAQPGPLPSSGMVQAGAAKVDLTPMPGFPMAGHSIGGTIARGYWTRLYARAIYLEDKAGHNMVLVSCDLWAMPAGLADRVAKILSAQNDAHHLSREQLILAATHTHQGPGNFSSARLYNDFAQRLAGFDPALFEFLAQKIASAILRAFRSRQPASVRFLETSLPGLKWNRSFEAFALNPESEPILMANADLPLPEPPRRDVKVYRAVDPRLSLLRITSATQPGAPIAIAVFTAVHPTAMSPKTEGYSSDLFGVASTLAEQELRKKSNAAAPVVAMFNGALGDMSPDWDKQDRRDAVRLGRLLAAKITAQEGDLQPVNLHITWRYRIVHLAGTCYEETSPFAAEHTIERCTAQEPVSGVAALGGAEDGRTVFYQLGWQEGVKATDGRSRDHGAKQPVFDPTFLPRPLSVSITKLVTPPPWFVPAKVPLGVYELNSTLAIATLPGEFTMVMGQRIADAVRQALASGPARVLLVGLANEYVSYFTTPEEYEAQHYEGASTLYGPNAGPLIGDRLQQLASANLVPPKRRRFSYSPGPQKSFGLRTLGAPPRTPDEGLGNIVQNLHTGLPVRDLPRFCWQETLPELSIPFDAQRRVTPQVSIERLHGANAWQTLVIDGVDQTDEGLNFVTIAIETYGQYSTWCTIWMPPAKVIPPTRLRFRVETILGPPVCSRSFELQHAKGVIGSSQDCG
jgi:neutral ceramidase